MEPQTLFNLLFTIIGILGGWILNNIKGSIDQLRRQDQELTHKVQQVEVLVAGNYTRREELDQFSQQVITHLRRIEDKIDKKADK